MAKRGGPRPNSGRPKGSKNRSTIAAEEAAKAQLAEALAASKAKGITPKNAMNELYKAMQVAEGYLAAVKPDITRDQNGRAIIKGGDPKQFHAWYAHWTDCIKELMKYQNAPMKAQEMPAPPPDPKELEAGSIKRFTLRVFEGGKPVESFKAGNGAA